VDIISDRLVKEFLVLIDDEYTIASDMAQLGLDKQRIIIANDIDQLNVMMQREGYLASEFGRLEADRYRIQQQLADLYQVPQTDATAAAIILKIQNSDRELALSLQEKIKQLQTVVEQLKEINRHNNDLIGFTLDYLDFVQSMLEGDVAGVYSDDGRPAEEQTFRMGKKILDHRI
jgi:flagellar biosynthesis/type III secretory pathway chaperone